MNECKPSTSAVRAKPVMVKNTLTAEQMLDKMYLDSHRSYYAIRRKPVSAGAGNVGAPSPQMRPKPARTVMGESTALYHIFQACKDCGYKFPHVDGFLYHVTEEHSLSADEIRALLVSAPFFRRSNRLGIRKLTSALNVAKEDRDLILKILLGNEVPKEDEKATESEEEYFKNDINHIPDMALEPYLFKYSGVNNASVTAKPQMVRVRTVARGGGARPNLKPMMMTKNIRPLTAPSPVVTKAPYGVSRAAMGRKAYFTTSSGEVRPVITVPRSVPAYTATKLPPIESSNEFLREKAAPHPCECKSEMRVVVDRTFSIEQKSIELMNELRDLLAVPPPPKRAKHRLDMMSDVPGKVVLPLKTKPVEQPVLEKEKTVVDEITLSSSDSDSGDEPAPGGVDDLHEMDDLSVHLSDEEDEEEKEDEEDVEEPSEDDPGCARARIITRKPKRPPVTTETDSDDEEMIITDDEAEEHGSPDVITLSDSSEHDDDMHEEDRHSHEEIEAEEVSMEDMTVAEAEATKLEKDAEANVPKPEDLDNKPVVTEESALPVITDEKPEAAEKPTPSEVERPFALPSVSTFTRRVASPVKQKSPEKMPISPPKFAMPTVRRVISPIKTASLAQKEEPKPDAEVESALQQAVWLRNGEPKTVFGENGERKVHHPTEGRPLDIEELLLCVCRLILTVKDRNITTIGFGVSTGDHEWMNTVEDNMITLALHHLVDAGLMTSGNMVFSKLRRSQIVNFKKSELALATYGLKANEYFV